MWRLRSTGSRTAFGGSAAAASDGSHYSAPDVVAIRVPCLQVEEIKLATAYYSSVRSTVEV